MKYAAPVVVAAGVVGVGLVGTPKLLGNFEFFEIRRIEVVGVRYLSADQILDAARIEEKGNLLRDLGDVEERIRNVPGVTDVQLDRKLPGTLKITLTEVVPVAFVIGEDALVPLDEHAQPLPYDPTAGPLDLPVVRHADSVLTKVLAAVRATAPALFDAIDDATRDASGGVVLSTGDRRLLLPAEASPEVVRSLMAVRQRILDATGDFRELDGRYEGLVISRGGTS